MKSKRKEHDFYPTPSWCTETIIDLLPFGAKVWEPCAGDLDIAKVLVARGFDVLCSDLYPKKPSITKLDATWTWDSDGKRHPEFVGCDLVVTNPPFLVCANIVRHFVQDLQLESWFLLRLGFLESQERAWFLKTFMPDVYVLSRRPSFTGDGGTDSSAYAWFHFHRGMRREGIVRVI